MIFIRTYLEVFKDRQEALEAKQSLKVSAESKPAVTTMSEMLANIRK